VVVADRLLLGESVDWDQPAAPRGTADWKKLYRLCGAVERENGGLKNEWACYRCGFAGLPP
jgi:hypothetical protein